MGSLKKSKFTVQGHDVGGFSFKKRLSWDIEQSVVGMLHCTAAIGRQHKKSGMWSNISLAGKQINQQHDSLLIEISP
jgi:hypothetical protein